MSEPRVVPYWTFYGNRRRRIMASDAYNAAANRMTKQTGQRWRCCDTCRIKERLYFVVRRGRRVRHVKVGID
jgi:hypothetical protein